MKIYSKIALPVLVGMMIIYTSCNKSATLLTSAHKCCDRNDPEHDQQSWGQKTPGANSMKSILPSRLSVLCRNQTIHTQKLNDARSGLCRPPRLDRPDGGTCVRCMGSQRSHSQATYLELEV